jgi:hypothetical protein
VRSRWLVGAAVVVTLTAGCGGGDDGAGNASAGTTGSTSTSAGAAVTTRTTSGDACDIVSDAVVAGVLGVPVTRREPHKDEASGTVSCIKGVERTSDVTTISYVSVSVFGGGGALVDAARAEAGSQPVDGVGDQAVYVPSAGALSVADGSAAIVVQVVRAGASGNQHDAITVARDVLDRR